MVTSSTRLAKLMVGQLPSVRRYARALVGEPTGADDLVQDCLERAWSRAHLLRSEGEIRVWLFAILHNLYVSDIRRQKRQLVVVPLSDQFDRTSVEAAQEYRLEISEVGRALAALPADQRAAVLLVGVEDMTYKEAADALAIPVGTLMSRLHRGRKQLRNNMAGGHAAPLKRAKWANSGR